jgi:MFS family permease
MPVRRAHPWQVLAITTVGVFLATVNASVVIISLPAIFRGLRLDPLQPGNVGYLLWLLLGYMVVTAVLVVAAGRLGDAHGKARMFTLGFGMFTLTGGLCGLVPHHGGTGALELVILRAVQGIGGSLLMANSTALITDAFAPTKRGLAVGINQVFAMAGSFVGLVVGGVLAEVDWRLVFAVVVPFGVACTIWSAFVLREHHVRRKVDLDVWGNLTFAVGLVAVLVAITYGIQPYAGHVTGWTNPFVLGSFIAGIALLVAFVKVEHRVEARGGQPMLNLGLFGIAPFAWGNAAGLLSSIARGGLQFMLILWLQGIWLPLHGYAFVDTPLWAGIYLLPLTIGFIGAGPVSGWLSDKYGARVFATGGMLITALSFGALMLLPTDFGYTAFAAVLLVNGLGFGLFASPNTTAILNSVPSHDRGTANGMRYTFMNSGMVLSMGLFFTLLVIGLSSSLPPSLSAGLTAHGVPSAAAQAVSHAPPVGLLFAAFLGYNPMGVLLPHDVLAHLPAGQASYLTGKTFFPQLIGGPFHSGLAVVFWTSIALCVLAAIASWLRGGHYVHDTVVARREPAADLEGVA